jgi:hypothetical protein
MKTIHEMRIEEEARNEALEKEKQRLKEKVLCVEVGLPKDMQEYVGITGYTVKLSELQKLLEDEFENNEKLGTFTLKVFERTNKWIESLPEADI